MTLEEVERLALDCKKCGHCCKFGSGFLVGDDFEKLANHLKVSVDVLKKDYLEEVEKFNTKLFRPKLIKVDGRPYGRCVFLEGNLCSVHDARPLQCRLGNCNEFGEELCTWFNLTYFLNQWDDNSVREYIDYLESGGKTLPGFELEKLVSKERLDAIKGEKNGRKEN